MSSYLHQPPSGSGSASSGKAKTVKGSQWHYPTPRPLPEGPPNPAASGQNPSVVGLDNACIGAGFWACTEFASWFMGPLFPNPSDGVPDYASVFGFIRSWLTESGLETFTMSDIIETCFQNVYWNIFGVTGSAGDIDGLLPVLLSRDDAGVRAFLDPTLEYTNGLRAVMANFAYGHYRAPTTSNYPWGA